MIQTFDQRHLYLSLLLKKRWAIERNTSNDQSFNLNGPDLVLEFDVGEVVKHPASPSSEMTVRAAELGEHDADEELLELVLVVLLLEEDVGHGADHVQGAVLLRRGCVVILKRKCLLSFLA